MQKCILIFIFSLALVFKIDANNIGYEDIMLCHTKVDTPCQIPFQNRVASKISRSNDSFYINVFFHILRMTDGAGVTIAPLNRMNERMYILNSDFNPHDMYFNYVGYDYIDNSSFYNMNASADSSLFNLLMHTQRIENAINIYLMPTSNNFVGGRSEGLPGCAFAIGGSFEHYTGDPEDYGTSHVLSHEMGHCLGLYHTFHGYNTNNYDPTNGFCIEYVDGSNCTSCGDYVCDTPADKYEGIKSKTHNSSCSWVNTVDRDIHGDLYAPDFSLVMSYNYPDCLTGGFTEGQANRMKDFLNYSPILQKVCLDYDVRLQNVTLQLDTTVIAVNSIYAGNNVDNTQTQGDVVIKNSTVVEFIANNMIELTSGFVIEPGATFIARNTAGITAPSRVVGGMVDNITLSEGCYGKSDVYADAEGWPYLYLLEHADGLEISLETEEETRVENIAVAFIVRAVGRTIIVEGSAGRIISLYDLSGRQVMKTIASDDNTEMPVDAGMYIVAVNGKAYKVVVR